jgi:hypothetical protein
MKSGATADSYRKFGSHTWRGFPQSSLHISSKNDPDQERSSRLSLAAIALANPDGHRLAFVSILHRRDNDPSFRCLLICHWRFSLFFVYRWISPKGTLAP